MMGLDPNVHICTIIWIYVMMSLAIIGFTISIIMIIASIMDSM